MGKNDELFPENYPKKEGKESGEAYHLKLLSASDINFILAKENFRRPAYYKKFMEASKNAEKG